MFGYTQNRARRAIRRVEHAHRTSTETVTRGIAVSIGIL